MKTGESEVEDVLLREVDLRGNLGLKQTLEELRVQLCEKT